MATKAIRIRFSALADPLSKQLKAQGFKFDKEIVKHFQLDIDAANRLRIRGNLLVDSAYDKVIAKLHRKILLHVVSENIPPANKAQ